MRPRPFVTVTASVLAAFVVIAAVGARGGDAPVRPRSLADLSFMAGHWSRDAGGTIVEEAWLPARGGFLIGMSRTTNAKGSEFEFLRITENAGKIAYVASPGGATPTSFPLTKLEPNLAVFENPEHDYPTTIRYERNGDSLTATISGPDGKDPMSWTWKLAAKLE